MDSQHQRLNVLRLATSILATDREWRSLDVRGLRVVDGDTAWKPVKKSGEAVEGQPVLYDAPFGFPDGYWVVYVQIHRPGPDLFIGPSKILVFSKDTLDLVFSGNAGDEA